MAQQTPNNPSSGFTTGADTGNQSVGSNNTDSNLFIPDDLEEIEPHVVERIGGADTEADAGMVFLNGLMTVLTCFFGLWLMFLVLRIFDKVLFTSTTRF
ncbi:hypothetical protein PFICI_00821 [Pestalotiopsis fici W106-1]|uniref:Uncharacterized protein n=1 Tax=Pestalotiopsis fici (strain W106-1 / CGMCC3.15140) TaxID=1229662 RepID=W3XLQ4_PESFW|nr:uncharacterized protein PFICI_00821 [Pestalotiopsis fici W106-1]ETS86993.1 hypothetical protein PFICI_00821 [Pestalotiopsis fici W106-1]